MTLGTLALETESANTISLRPASSSDEAFLLALYTSTRRDEVAQTNWTEEQQRAFIEMQFNARRQHYDSYFPTADNRIITSSGKAIGRILVDRGESDMLLVDIALLPEHCNRGIGRRLIQDLIDEGDATGKAVRLNALKFSRAIRLYESLGFSEVGDDGLYVEMRRASRDERSTLAS